VPTGPRYDEAAWYDGSAAPGAVGTAVILGHVDSVEDGPSVFYDLGRLRPGDEISVSRADGSVARFTVDGVRRYPKDEFPSLVVYGDTDYPALRLITCGGEFDQSTGHYEDNVVVFASSADAPSLRPAGSPASA
jgi:sortase (surface protein transpeptidase)